MVDSIVDLKGQIKTVVPSTSEQTISPDAQYNGLTSVTVNAVTSAIDSNIVADNIKKDVSILGVTGTYAPEEGINTSDANATADDIVVNKTAYVNGQKITGTIPTATTITGDGSIQVSDGTIKASATISNNTYLYSDSAERTILINLTENQIAEALGITADKIKAGEVICGIEGIYSGETVE